MQTTLPRRADRAFRHRPGVQARPPPRHLADDLADPRSGRSDHRRVEGCAGYHRAEAGEESLREANRRKDEFLALLAHELRNPLAPLRNGLQIMRLAAGDPNAVAQARGIMERQLGHMVRLIDDLLDVSRINRNKMELRRSRVLLADVISNAVETVRPLIDARELTLDVSLPTEPEALDADLTRLAQVFGNLLTNSAKYTDPGGHIWLTAERRGDDVLVSVRDDGIGIPAEALSSIFDMFSQVDRSIERSTGGLGIGLALVKGLVEMHGGTVTAESDGPGKGQHVHRPAPRAGNRPGASVAGDSRTRDGLERPAAAHPRGGRQPGLGDFLGQGAQAPRKRSADRARRRGGRGSGGRVSARDHPDGRRYATLERLRSHAPHSRAAVGAIGHHHRAHRLGTRR